MQTGEGVRFSARTAVEMWMCTLSPPISCSLSSYPRLTSKAFLPVLLDPKKLLFSWHEKEDISCAFLSLCYQNKKDNNRYLKQVFGMVWPFSCPAHQTELSSGLRPQTLTAVVLWLTTVQCPDRLELAAGWLLRHCMPCVGLGEQSCNRNEPLH